MKKIVNTLRYGDGKTKFILILTFLAGVGTVALFACAFIFSQMILFFGGVICAFITITLAQTFGIEQQDIPEAKLVDDSAIGNILNNVEHTAQTSVVEETKEKQEKLHEKKVEAQVKEQLKKEEFEQAEQVELELISEEKSNQEIDETWEEVSVEESDGETEEVEGEETQEIEETPTKKKKEKKKKEKTKKVEDEEPSQEDEEKPSKKSKKQKEVELNLEEATVEEVLETYTKKTIKKTMHKYKVKKDHRMVIIDNCHKLHIHQAPAYVWVSDKEFNILVIEKEPRHLTLPIFAISEITYLKKQPGNAEKDYPLFKGNSVMANLFSPYLPDYSYSTRVDDLTAYKNLYGIGPGIYFTNNSAANLFDLLGVSFYVEDKITTSNKANHYFKEIYKCNILLRDNVIDANGYADKVSNHLDDMAHSTISYNEFRDTLNLLIKNKLITQEFASHFAEIRDKISR